METEKLYNLIDKYIEEKGEFIFPAGFYGGLVYKIDDEGIYGPFDVPSDWDPMIIHESARRLFLARLPNSDLKLDDFSDVKDLDQKIKTHIDLFDGLLHSHDYGGIKETLIKPQNFIEMILFDCEPGCPYVKKPDGKFHDLYDVINEDDLKYQKWDDLAEKEIKEWAETFERVFGFSKLKDLADKYSDKHGILVYPRGKHGGEAYRIDDDGICGPYDIPDYVVPIQINDEAKKTFLKRLEKSTLDLDDFEDEDIFEESPEVIEELTDGLDLSYGDESDEGGYTWTMTSEEFISMIVDDCEPGVHYVEEYGHYTELDDVLLDGDIWELTEWSEMDEYDIAYWIDFFEENL